MSIDVEIKQKGFFKKPMPMEVILGNALQYGSFRDGLVLEEGERSEDEFIAYSPAHIARGFSVTWKPGEKKQIVLRALHPTVTEELRDFYATVKRITDYWKCSLTVDGNRVTAEQFLAGYPDAVEFNRKNVEWLIGKQIDEPDGGMTLISAKFPLVFGKPEAEEAKKDPDFFAHWLHEKQSADIFYDTPDFRKTEKGIVGRYALIEGLPTVFPQKPSTPFGLTDTDTGKPVECHLFEVSIYSNIKKEIIGTFPYDRVLSVLPSEKISRFDAGNYLISPLSPEEAETLVNVLNS